MNEDIVDLGLPTQDLDELLELGATVATGHDNLIVFMPGELPELQAWS